MPSNGDSTFKDEPDWPSISTHLAALVVTLERARRHQAQVYVALMDRALVPTKLAQAYWSLDSNLTAALEAAGKLQATATRWAKKEEATKDAG
jgi:hypothetical protein